MFHVNPFSWIATKWKKRRIKKKKKNKHKKFKRNKKWNTSERIQEKIKREKKLMSKSKWTVNRKKKQIYCIWEKNVQHWKNEKWYIQVESNRFKNRDIVLPFAITGERPTRSSNNYNNNKYNILFAHCDIFCYLLWLFWWCVRAVVVCFAVNV